MSDIELPDLPDSRIGAIIAEAIGIVHDFKDYSRFHKAALAVLGERDQEWRVFLADREKRAQAAQGEVAAYQYLFDGIYGEVWRNSSEIWNGQKPKASRPLYAHPATEASKPVQAEAPTASNAERVKHLSRWKPSGAGVMSEDYTGSYLRRDHVLAALAQVPEQVAGDSEDARCTCATSGPDYCARHAP